MSRIDALIADLCPDGVEFCALSEVAKLQRGTSITRKSVVPGPVPVVAGGRGPAYFHSQSNRSGSTITIAGSGAYAGHVSWWDIPIFVSDAFSVKPSSSRLDAKYCFYWMQNIQADLHALKSGGGVPHVYPRDVAKIRLAIPPLAVQLEIVKILDRFTQLEAELEAELEARRLQYSYYLNSLMNAGDDVQWIPMGELGSFVRGRRFTKADMVDAGIPSIHYGEIYTHYGVSTTSTISHVRSDLASQLRYAQPGDIVIVSVGETVEDVGKAVAWLGDGGAAIHDDSFLFRHTMNPKFVSYFFQTDAFHSQKSGYVSRAKVKRLSGESLAKVNMPVVPPDEQERIVSILDKFDMLVNDVSDGLPAELTARRKQYKHYRHHLLMFKELAV